MVKAKWFWAHRPFAALFSSNVQAVIDVFIPLTFVAFISQHGGDKKKLVPPSLQHNKAKLLAHLPMP